MRRTKRTIIITTVVVAVIVGALAFMLLSEQGPLHSFVFGDGVKEAMAEQTGTQQGVSSEPQGTVQGVSTDGTSTPEQTTGTQEQQDGSEETQAGTEPVKDVKEFKVKAIYLTGNSAGLDKVLDRCIDIINKTELNAIVIDIKEEGYVNYKSSIPLVVENGLDRKFYNVDKVIQKLHDNNIYVIGRIVCFRDNGLATKFPEQAIKRPDGALWKEGTKLGSWTSAYNEKNWDYNIEIAKEAVSKGFDEIQFDYVRFPTTTKKNPAYYGENPPPKADAICGFLKKAADELHAMGAAVSADVFGIIAEIPSDGRAIGQVIERVGMDIDAISPMVYPSHYANAAKKGFMANGSGQEVNGVLFTHPDLKPYEVVYNTLLGIKKSLSGVAGYKARVRPYLQGFTASYLPDGYYKTYGPEEFKQQIKAVIDAGYEEWIFWDPRNKYPEDAFEVEKQ